MKSGKLQSGNLPKGKGRRFVRVDDPPAKAAPPPPPGPPSGPPRGPRPPRGPMKPWVSALLAGFFAPLFCFSVWAGWTYRVEVVDYAGPEMEKEKILAVIAQESPVTYRDGRTRLGVFFDQEHRQYLRYEQFPKNWVNAIVAAEDSNFFAHPGVDPKHILRASIQNLRAGKVVAGGSTLTQQTAKNLFYRPDRSLRSKWTELLNALRLERLYSKEEILEFYGNQFHVSANGRGLAIGARYFFDKSVDQLSLKECAFLAGLVKAPSRYNPFIGQSPERRDQARRAAEDRTAYVLRRMLEEGHIDERVFQEALTTPLEFNRGTFQYDRSIVLDEVQSLLETPTFLELFEKAGIDNPSTAGIQITTTLDPVVQREATWALWHHLTELGPVLERAGAWALVIDPKSLPAPGLAAALEVHGFHYATVTKATEEKVELDLSGRPCVVGKAGIERMSAVLARARTGNPNAPADATATAAMVAELRPGKVVLASVRELGETPSCDLEIRPKLQGAVVVLEQGQLRALVGGNDNRNFDRALTATRQLGSTWKPLVYNAALHLGWQPDDLLDNRRNVFPFRDVWYYPRPDHPSDPVVSMSLSGARSENLSSVWLLYHLTDRLDATQLKALATDVGLLPAGGETGEAWMRRLRDGKGLRSSPDRFEEYAFTVAKQEVLASLPFPEDALALRSLIHGAGSSAERARVMQKEDSEERRSRLAALDGSLLSLEELVGRCQRDLRLVWDDPESGKTACGERSPGTAWVQRVPPEEALPEDVVENTQPAEPTENLLLSDDSLIDGRIHLGTLTALRAATERQEAALSGRDPWDPEVLLLHPDFRKLVGIEWLQKLASAYGVRTALPTVLSLPLGAADITLVEAASMYQGFSGGKRWVFPGEGYGASTVSGLREAYELPDLDLPAALIAEIRDASGNVLYRLRPEATEVADPKAGELVGDILRNVVRWGTGRRARDVLKVGDQPVALAGKTGTTNDYRNAAFIGFVPKYSDGTAQWDQNFTVAAYVGYDDNRSMRRGSFRVQGANGALPVWLGTASGLLQANMVGSPGVSAGGGWRHSEGLEERPVLEGTGFPRDVAATPDGPTTLVPVGGLRHYAIPGVGSQETAATVEVPPVLVETTPLTEDLPPEEGAVPLPPAGLDPSIGGL